MAQLKATDIYGDLRVKGKINSTEEIYEEGVKLVEKYSSFESTNAALLSKQDKLTAGSSIEIVDGNIINALAKPTRAGTGNFTGSGGETTIPHGLGVVPIAATAFPTENPLGFLGEVWIRMDITNLYIGNTGSFSGAMSWTAVQPE